MLHAIMHSSKALLAELTIPHFAPQVWTAQLQKLLLETRPESKPGIGPGLPFVQLRLYFASDVLCHVHVAEETQAEGITAVTRVQSYN